MSYYSVNLGHFGGVVVIKSECKKKRKCVHYVGPYITLRGRLGYSKDDSADLIYSIHF